MLPQETSVRQLKKLRAETKGKDIGDLTAGDRLNHNVPNLQYIGNPVDAGIESWQEFSQKDSKLQTIAFKSKTVNKPLVNEFFGSFQRQLIKDLDYDLNDNKDEKCRKCDGHYRKTQMTKATGELTCDKCDDKINRYTKIKENNNKDMKNKENVLTLEDFYNVDELDKIDFDHEFTEDELDKLEYQHKKIYDEDEDDEDLVQGEHPGWDDEFENVKTFEAFSVPAAPKKEKQPEYTMLGKEKELESNPNFGVGEVIQSKIKKISDFNLIDPPTPKERTIGGNAGQFIDNGTVKGFINRIEGKDVYVESVDEPMKINKFNIKDVIKTKKEDKK